MQTLQIDDDMIGHMIDGSIFLFMYNSSHSFLMITHYLCIWIFTLE